MSWSMYLSGPKGVILKELADATAVINQAAESLEGTHAGSQDSLSVSVEGYVSWDEKGVISSHTGHNISVNRYVPPAEPVPAEAVSAQE